MGRCSRRLRQAATIQQCRRHPAQPRGEPTAQPMVELECTHGLHVHTVLTPHELGRKVRKCRLYKENLYLHFHVSVVALGSVGQGDVRHCLVVRLELKLHQRQETSSSRECMRKCVKYCVSYSVSEGRLLILVLNCPSSSFDLFEMRVSNWIQSPSYTFQS